MKALTTTLGMLLGLAAAASAAPNPPPSSAPAMPGAVVKPAATPEQMSAVDDALKKAEFVVLDVEAVAHGGADGTGCPPTFSLRDYLSDIRAKRLSKETGGDVLDTGDGDGRRDAGPKLALRLYYHCQAVAMNNPGGCAELDALNAGNDEQAGYDKAYRDPRSAAARADRQRNSASYGSICVSSYYRDRARRAYVARDPRFGQYCRDSVPHLTALKTPGSVEGICNAWAAFAGDPAPMAAAIRAGVAADLTDEASIEIVREMTASEGGCAEQPDAYSRQACAEFGDFRRALAARSARACKGGLCRVLMGESAAACEPYAKKLKTMACRQAYSGDFVVMREKAFKSYSDQIEAVLSGDNAPIGDEKKIKEFNARLDRLYDLRDRFDAAAAVLAPKSVPKAAAPARKKGA